MFVVVVVLVFVSGLAFKFLSRFRVFFLLYSFGVCCCGVIASAFVRFCVCVCMCLFVRVCAFVCFA